jgi:branched-chain amino acid transport system permease protein
MVGGLALGGAYALIATAYSLVYRTSRTINFAQGDLAIFGAYVAFAGPAFLAHNLLLGALAGIAAVAVLSMVIEVLAFRPLYRHGPVYVVASSIALVFVLETVMRLIWGASTIDAPAIISGSVTVAGVTASAQQLLILGVTGVLLVALQALFRSRIGVAMRSSAENREVSRLLGIRPDRMITASFALAGVATAVAGILVASLTLLRPNAGGVIGLTAVVAAILGGFGSMPGALLGGLLIGLIEVWGSYLIGGEYSHAVTFGILILVLLVRPSGLLGEEGLVARQ